MKLIWNLCEFRLNPFNLKLIIWINFKNYNYVFNFKSETNYWIDSFHKDRTPTIVNIWD